MKFVNFIDAMPSRNEKSTQRWLWMSAISILLTAGVIFSIEMRQISHYHEICISCACCAKTDADHAQLQKHFEELQTRDKELQEKIALCAKQKEAARQTIARFNSLLKFCCGDCHLESYAANDHDLQMTILGPSSEHISHLIASLSASKAFNSLILTSMQPKIEKGYIFTIKDHC